MAEVTVELQLSQGKVLTGNFSYDKMRNCSNAVKTNWQLSLFHKVRDAMFMMF